jgi:hypothetical protein
MQHIRSGKHQWPKLCSSCCATDAKATGSDRFRPYLGNSRLYKAFQNVPYTIIVDQLSAVSPACVQAGRRNDASTGAPYASHSRCLPQRHSQRHTALQLMETDDAEGDGSRVVCCEQPEVTWQNCPSNQCTQKEDFRLTR